MNKQTSKKLREDVHKFIKDEDYAKAVGCLREGMAAKHVVRRSREDGERGVDYDEVPDHGVRLTSARLMLEYGFGKPATRHEISVSDNTQRSASPTEIMSRLRDSGQNLAEIMDIYTNSVKEAEMVPNMVPNLELENDE